MSAPPTDDNRRRSDRKVLRTQAYVSLPGHPPFTVRTLDISSGGMAIVASANPKPGTSFTIQFTIPVKPKGGAPFTATAKVVHSVFSSGEDGFKVGLAFTNLDPPSASAILQFFK